jgi:hypothetical protein
MVSENSPPGAPSILSRAAVRSRCVVVPAHPLSWRSVLGGVVRVVWEPIQFLPLDLVFLGGGPHVSRGSGWRLRSGRVLVDAVAVRDGLGRLGMMAATAMDGAVG